MLVHAPFTGQRTLWLPQSATVYDVMEDKIIAVDTRSFRAFLRARTTRLFLWGDREAIQEATGLPLPSASEPGRCRSRRPSSEVALPAPAPVRPVLSSRRP